jgi:hypothetical protein
VCSVLNKLNALHAHENDSQKWLEGISAIAISKEKEADELREKMSKIEKDAEEQGNRLFHLL